MGGADEDRESIIFYCLLSHDHPTVGRFPTTFSVFIKFYLRFEVVPVAFGVLYRMQRMSGACDGVVSSF